MLALSMLCVCEVLQRIHGCTGVCQTDIYSVVEAGTDNEDTDASDGEYSPEADNVTPANEPEGAGPGAAGGHVASLEDVVFQRMSSIIEAAPEEAAEVLMAERSPYAERFRDHARVLFGGNTEEGTSGKVGDWLLYCSIVYPDALPSLDDVIWPPSLAIWESFLEQARPRVSSAEAFRRVFCNVCQVAVRHWTRKLGCRPADIDPRKLYEIQHANKLSELSRHYGVGVRQVAAITMHEARNGPHFGDHDSVRGVAACAAFSMGCLMGGRRPRTLTAILLRHVELTVGQGIVAGVWVRVPHMRVTFVDEKFADVQGFRMATDKPFPEGYDEKVMCSPAFWVYRLCVMRGVLVGGDPLRTAALGDKLLFRSECLGYYLFCEVHSDHWIDTAPSAVGTLGRWNGMLLKRMGSKPRPFSSQRPGFVSRSCILCIIDARGKELSQDMIEVMIRLGGWQGVTGARTVLRIYARKILDEFVDAYALSLGFEASEEQWQRVKQEYLGAPVFPSQPCIDHQRSLLPLQVRMHAWHSMSWQSFLQKLNRAAAAVMQAANADPEVMPIARYRQARRAYNVFRKLHPEAAMVAELEQLLSERKAVWEQCLTDSFDRSQAEFFHGNVVSDPHVYLTANRFLSFLQPLEIGNVSIGGLPVNVTLGRQIQHFTWTK